MVNKDYHNQSPGKTPLRNDPLCVMLCVMSQVSIHCYCPRDYGLYLSPRNSPYIELSPHFATSPRIDSDWEE